MENHAMKTNKRKTLPFNLGDIIRNILAEKGMKQTHFAEKMGFGDSNASHLLNRKDWPLSKVLQASEILGTNLFSYMNSNSELAPLMVAEDGAVYQSANVEKLYGNVKKQLSDCENMRDLQKEHIELLRMRITMLERKLDSH